MELITFVNKFNEVQTQITTVAGWGKALMTPVGPECSIKESQIR